MRTHTLQVTLVIATLLWAIPRAPAQVQLDSRGDGDLHFVAAQPFLTTDDFRSPQNLEDALGDLLQIAKDNDFLNATSVVVFPELLGLYLYFMSEKDSVYRSESLFAAGTDMVKARLLNPRRAFGFLAQPPFLLRGKPMDMGALFYRKLLNEKAPEVARTYQSIFSHLAREFAVVIVAGSVPLPSPYVDADGNLSVDVRGNMMNVSAVFYPDGRMDSKLTRKTRPTSYEEKDLFISPQDVANLPVYDLPFGTLGIAVCADSWYPEIYNHFESLGTDFLVVPGYIAGAHAGEAVWQGYNYTSGITPPNDVNELDIGWLTEWEAWSKYSLPGRLPQTSIQVGLSAFMKGHLWGDLFYGSPHRIQRGEVHTLDTSSHEGSLALLRVSSGRE
jgi:predicted amidohydrolase